MSASTLRCEICGKPPSGYPNWLLSKGHGYHVGCLAEDYRRLQKVFKAADRASRAYGAKDGPKVPEMELLGMEIERAGTVG